MAHPEHVRWLLEGKTAWNNRRIYQDFTPDLSGEDLTTKLRDSKVTTENGTPDLEGMNLSKALLNDCILSDASLVNANLNAANLQRTRLEQSSLAFADLTQANLQESNLTSAQLIGARLVQANLQNCQLQGATLDTADLVGAKLTGSRFWQASMSSVFSPQWNYPRAQIGGSVTNIDEVLQQVNVLKRHYSPDGSRDTPIFYFRGESRSDWDLTPSVMRPLKDNRGSLRNVEGEMLVDLRSRRAEDFLEASSALDQMVLAQHHSLPTRLLDVTCNPLVALFHASEKPVKMPDADGQIHVFAVPVSLVKQFNSDTVSVITNFARLRRSEQNLVLGKTKEETKSDIDPGYGTGWRLGDLYDLAMNRLYQFIRLEKPSFQDRIDPIDLLRVIVVEPRRAFERIRAQSGAFLISAFHERFEELEIQKWTADLPIYHHYTLAVPNIHKERIGEDLATFNLTRETMFPGLDEAAKSVKGHYQILTS